MQSIAAQRPSPECHPCFGDFGRLYYPAVFGQTRDDISFSANGMTILATRSTVESIDYYGFPVQVFYEPDADEKALRSVLGFVERSTVQIADYRYSDSPLSMACDDLGLKASLKVNAVCDLSGGESQLHRHLRKSYRSLVNWGRKNFAMTYVNSANPDRVAFAQYQDFHKKIAGRSTRPQASWDVMFDWITAGGGELSLGHISSGELVSGTLVVDGTTTAYYCSGVYDRERFDKPIGHWPLYDSIIRSIDRGMKIYDIGDIPQKETVSKKEFDIGMFKRGFATDLLPFAVWSRLNS